MKHEELSWHASDGQQFHGLEWRPEGETRAVVCLVHGLGEHAGRYAHVAQALCDAGYALLAFDLRGHGQTPGRRGHAPSWETALDDIARLLDEGAQRFPGLPRFLYGHSLGGTLVLAYALRRKPQVAGVIATGPVLKLPQPVPPAKLALGRFMYRVLPSFQLANGLDRAGLSRDPEVVRRYNEDPLVHDRVSARLAADMLDSGEWDIAHAAEFALPLLLMHGTADRITWAEGSRQFAAKLKGDCTFRLWQGLYHEIHNEPEQKEVLGFMIHWLQAHTL